MKNDILDCFKYISNLENNEIEKPIKIISENVEFESNLQTINKSVDVLKDLIKNNTKVELKENTFKNLTDFIDNNDYNSYTNVDEIIDQNEENNKNFWEKFKENVNDNVKSELTKIVEANKNDKNLQYELVKHMKEKGYDITQKKLTHSQKEKKNTISKMFNCINSIGQSEKGFSEENLNEMANLLKNNNNQSKDFQKLKKKEVIKIINKTMESNTNQILTDDLMDEISKEINSKKQKSVLNILNTASNNQKLTGEAKLNLLDLLHDDRNKNNNDNDDSISIISNENDLINEEERFDLVYQILDKRQDDLNKDEKNIFELEKNTRNIKSEDDYSKVSESLNNISEIVKQGYNINKHTEKEITKLIEKEDKNESIIENSTKIINNMVINNKEISKEVSEKVINKINNNSNKLSKKSLEQLLACLVNIIDNCNVPKGAVETFD